VTRPAVEVTRSDRPMQMIVKRIYFDEFAAGTKDKEFAGIAGSSRRALSGQAGGS
jgi:hypothetical protein